MRRSFVVYNMVVISIFITIFLAIIFSLTSFINQRQTAYMLDVILEDTVTTYNEKTITDADFALLYENSPKRLTILDPFGEPIADSMRISVGGNQSEYPEIINLGSAYTRYSDTLKMNLMYKAARAENGNYIRVAIIMDQNQALNNQSIILLGIITIGALVITYFALKKTGDSFLRPIHEIADSVKSIKDGQYEWVLPATEYDEINELLREINSVNEQIVTQIANLETQEAELQILLNNMHQGVLLIGSDETIVLYNDLAKKWLKIDKDMPLYNIREKQVYDAIKRATKAEIDEKFKLTIDDAFISLSVRSVLNKILIKDQNKFGCLVLIVDDTERIRLENNKRDFFANASHELRTPLTAIKGSAELILYDMATKEEKIGLSKEIIRQIETMDALLKDMLELSRLETRPKSDKQTVNLKQLLDQVLEQLHPFIINKNIKVSISTSNVLYSCIDSDIKSLFKNLIENAIKYNKNDGVIDIILSETASNVIFVIKDSGIGIPKEHQTRIFERFYQVNKTRSKLQNGTGLGLAIVKHVVSYYEGSIEIESEIELGTTFTITLKKPKVS